MTHPKPHRIRVGRNAWLNTGLFDVNFYGPMTPDSKTEPWGWYQANMLVKNYKEAVAEFTEWVAITREYIDD